MEIVKHRAKILITTDELAALLGYKGGRIFQVKLDSDSFDDCVVITMEHDSLPKTRPEEILRNIRWVEVHDNLMFSSESIIPLEPYPGIQPIEPWPVSSP